MDYDAGQYIPVTFTGQVWDDLDADGTQVDLSGNELAGVTVNLRLASDDSLIGTDTTIADGSYTISGITPGQAYYIEFALLGGYEFSPLDQGGNDALDSDANTTNGRTATITPLSGNTPDHDAGQYIPVTFTGQVWDDLDADGTQNDLSGNELAGVTVNLRLASDDSLVGADTTIADGSYTISGITPGANYYIEFVLLGGYEFSPLDQGGDDALDSDADTITGYTATITPLSGDTVDYDAGQYIPVTFTGRVWDDLDADGTQNDLGGNDIAGVTVNLRLASDDSLVGSDVTDATGTYTIPNITPGTNYYIEFTLLGGYEFSPLDQGGDDALDSDANTITGRTATITPISGDIVDYDAGQYIPVTFTGQVWDDLDADGTQNELSGNELAGVTVNLRRTADDSLAGSDITLADGSYTISGITPGTDYYIEVLLMGSYVHSPLDQGGNDAVDSDVDPATSRTAGITPLSSDTVDYDAGLYIPVEISGQVWHDLDADGTPNELLGNELPGATVRLWNVVGPALIDTQTTGAAGDYIFTNVLPGETYYVEFMPLGAYFFSPQDAGGDDALDSDPDQSTGQTTTVSPLSGNTSDFDAGMTLPVTFTGQVWDDLNGDGTQDDLVGNELTGFTVELWDAANVLLLGTQGTIAGGVYSFPNQVAGQDYFVRVIAQGGYVFTLQDQGGNDLLDSDVDLLTGDTSPVTPVSGAVIDLDAGLYIPVIISGSTWHDLNNNGLQEGEPAQAGVTVELYEEIAGPQGTTSTNAAGDYSFTGFPPGTYYVWFLTPAGYYLAPDNVGADDTIDSDADPASAPPGETDHFTLDSGDTADRDAGYWTDAYIGDLVWEDMNGNGLQDGEPGLPGVQVDIYEDAGGGFVPFETVTTDASGVYSNTIGMNPAYPYYAEVIPAGYEITVLDAGADDTIDNDFDPVTGETAPFNVVSGATDDTIDAGLYLFAAVDGLVWDDINQDGVQDLGELGEPNVLVELWDATETAVIDSTLTDCKGLYNFTNIVPGDYVLRVTAPAGYSHSPQDAGGDDLVDSDYDLTGRLAITLASNDAVIYDAGIYAPATLMGELWNDLDTDGEQDAGELLMTQSITVELLDTTPAVVDTVVTTTGLYTFTGIIPGTYTVRVTQPAGYDFSPMSPPATALPPVDSNVDPLTGETPPIALSSNQTLGDVDAGMFLPTLIGDFVWHDLNANGIQDIGEPGMDGVPVNLLDAVMFPVASTLTAGGGYYSFADQPEGNYTLQVVPLGFISPQDQGGDDALDNDFDMFGQFSFFLPWGTQTDTFDAGIYVDAQIDGRVWNDLDANGIQDVGEPDMNGVTVRLWDVVLGAPIDSTTTVAGAYSFTATPGRDYYIEVLLPANFVFGPQDQGGDDLVDSDFDPATGLGPTFNPISGATLGYDAGLFQPVTFSGTVWHDLNADSVQDGGEPGLVGIQVDLYDGAATWQETQFTDPSGNYSFTGYVEGTYYIDVDPGSYEHSPQASDSDPDPVTGQTAPFLAAAGAIVDQDAGLYQLAQIGDLIWEDMNGNGLQDGEPGYGGVTVNLLDATGTVTLDTTTSAVGTGAYQFTVDPGDYIVEIVLPGGMWRTYENQGADDTIDSDFNASYQVSVTVTSGAYDDTIDGGVFTPVVMQGFVWDDVNGNGIKDGGEGDYAGVFVEVVNAGTSGTEYSSTTLADGLYSFDMWPGAAYYVELTLPGGEVISPQDQGGNDAVDSDFDPATRRSPTTPPIVSGDAFDYDAGLFIPAVFTGTVWEDMDGDGEQDAGEVGVPGITVNIYDGAMALFDTQLTAAAGDYSFDVPAGTYTIEVVPGGYNFSPQDAVGDTVDSDVDQVTGRTASYAAFAGETVDQDAGVYLYGQIGDFMWEDLNADGIQDAGESGLAGVTVVLMDPTFTVTIDSTISGGIGFYQFTNITPGDYGLFINSSPVGAVSVDLQDQTTEDLDNDFVAAGFGPVVTVTSGSSNPDVDGGFYFPGQVTMTDPWEDLNGNGVQEGGDNALPVGTSTITLWDAGPDGLAGTADDTVESTNNQGFTDTTVRPGPYFVEYTLPAGWDFTVPGTDSDVDSVTGRTAVFAVQSGDILSFSAGMWEEFTFSGWVWYDVDQDGRQDVTELLGIDGATVELRDGGGVVSSTLTAGGGLYSLTVPPGGSYWLRFISPPPAPLGYVFSPEGIGAEATDSDASQATGDTASVTATSGVTQDYDAGMYQQVALTGRVWEDLNGNGIQDGGELDLMGIPVDLLNSSLAVIASTLTDASGTYTFTGLDANSYAIQVTPGSYMVTLPNVGDDNFDSDADATGLIPLLVLPQGTLLDQDAGLVMAGTISGFVWDDTNTDGIQDGGETGLAGVLVEVLDSGMLLITSTSTNGTGNYSFSVLPGSYYIRVTLLPPNTTFSPQDVGGDDAVDSDVDGTGVSGLVTIVPSGTADIDAGQY
ncbi:MAG: hypothetical protein K8S97_14960 [Anaerolineae bacterium]|nr:hypothetical protein [Anaerolineae bacterium]